MARPFAAFDIDGTIIRWQLYHALADEMARRGLLGNADFQQVKAARLAWKKRETATSYEAYENLLIETIEGSMAGIAVADFEAACEVVLAEYKDQVYAYTRDLIRRLKADDYLLFAISASQSQIVQMVADYYNFDDFGGSTYGTENGVFTGESYILKHDRKPELLEQLVQKHGATWQGSWAVGDSDGDIPMLSSVEQPIAFNPTKQLYEHAKSQGWRIVIERKNMVYQLTEKDGSYQLEV